FTNIHIWSKEVPDIDERSARLFSLWAEDMDTREVLGVVHGYFVLVPFIITPASVREFYTLQENTPYYPMAIVNSLRTIIQEDRKLDRFLYQMRDTISQNWSEVRIKTIRRLKKGSEIWKRYILSIDKIIHYTFLCASIDRELIDALQRNDYRIRKAIEEKLEGYGTLEKLFSSEVGKEIIEKIQLIPPEDFRGLIAVEIKNYEIFSEIYNLIKDPEYKIQISDEEIQKATQKMNKIAQKMNKADMKKLIEEDEEIQEIIIRRMVKTLKPLSNEVKKEFLKALNGVEKEEAKS
ncbi:MAG: hypothetical protein ACFFAJ_17445, partial [Candidatus Hodarchaeota archaeon]